MFGRWGNVVAGLWLVIAPWVLGYPSASAKTNDFWVGLTVIAVALVSTRVSGFRFVNTGLGAWLVMAPFLLSYGTLPPVLNDLFVGMAVIALSLVPSVRWTRVRRRERLPTA